MGKKQRAKPSTLRCYPLVSVCTPTFNRRPFIPAIINCFKSQTYPMDKLEWIVIDDGTDKVGDLFEGIPQVKYFSYDDKMVLGKKRNLMHDKSNGEIIVYMDDDDFYPPDRVEHAVRKLQSNPKVLCGGASEMHIYFKKLDKIYQFGPYGPNHATAGTFAFKRRLLDESRYDETAALAEEKSFLKGYTIPFIQFDTRKTILVFSHKHNTFDKSKLLENPNPKVVKESKYRVSDFIRNDEVADFYKNKIDSLLDNYELGTDKYKPDVVEQTKLLEEQRKKAMEQNQPRVTITDENGKESSVSVQELVEMLNKSRRENHALRSIIKQMQANSGTS